MGDEKWGVICPGCQLGIDLGHIDKADVPQWCQAVKCPECGKTFEYTGADLLLQC
jgi:endogenous inhibitor of DNA gyrase (YacG/DUF329 family)